MSGLFKMPTAHGNALELGRYKDFVYHNIPFMDPKLSLEFIDNFTYQPDDIFTCSYPKCGTHWIGNMIWKLKTIDDFKRPKLTLVEFREPECYDLQDAPRILHTHLRPSHLPKEHIQNNGKVALMIRNPKDVCVSFYHLLKNIAVAQSGQTWEEFFDSFISGGIPYGSYFEYLEEWKSILQARERGEEAINFEVFFYEDCKRDQANTIARLNTFLQFNRDEDYLAKVLEESGFEFMKKQETLVKDRINQFVKDADGNSVIYRRGEVGDWKNYFTEAQSCAIDDIMEKKKLNDTFRFKYEL